MDLVVKTATAKFDETVEAHIKLGVDSRHADQQVRGAIVLPERHRQDPQGPRLREGRASFRKLWTQALISPAVMDMVEKITKENWFDFRRRRRHARHDGCRRPSR